MKRSMRSLIALLLLIAVLCSTCALAADAPADWASEEIALAKQAGLITPSTQGIYTATTTRYQFAELIVNLMEKLLGRELEAAPADTFTDCSDLAVLKAYRAGIVNGMSKNPPEFRPNRETTREEIATMIYNMLHSYKTQTGRNLAPKGADFTGYVDVGQLSGWSEQAVGVLAANNIMKGTSATNLSPKSPCQVQMCVLLLWRLYDKAVNAGTTESDFYYEDYPQVPDFGAYLDVPVKKVDAAAANSTTYYYGFPESVTNEGVMNYLNLLKEHGFRSQDFWRQGGTTVFDYRSTNDLSLMVELRWVEKSGREDPGIYVTVYAGYQGAQPQELRFYDEFPAVPDFGAATGQPLREKEKTSDQSGWIYIYQNTCVDNVELAVTEQLYRSLLFEYGYYYSGNYDVSDDGGLQACYVFSNESGSSAVVLAFSRKQPDGNYYWVVMAGSIQ